MLCFSGCPASSPSPFLSAAQFSLGRNFLLYVLLMHGISLEHTSQCLYQKQRARSFLQLPFGAPGEETHDPIWAKSAPYQDFASWVSQPDWVHLGVRLFPAARAWYWGWAVSAASPPWRPCIQLYSKPSSLCHFGESLMPTCVIEIWVLLHITENKKVP